MPPDPAVPGPVVPPEVVLEVALVFEFASGAVVLSGPEGGVEQPHSMAVSKLN